MSSNSSLDSRLKQIRLYFKESNVEWIPEFQFTSRNKKTTAIDVLKTLQKGDYKIMQVSDRSSHRKCSDKKGILKNFVKFTGKCLC